MTTSVIKYAPVAISVGLVAFLVWYSFKPDAVPVGVSTPLPVAKEVAKVEPVKDVVKYVYVYPKSVKPKLNLPKHVAEDDSEKVTSSSKLQAERRDYTITSVLDVDSGKTTIYARPDPLPWLGMSHEGEASLAYGYKQSGPVVRLTVNQNFLRVKSVHFGATGTLDSDGSYFAGLSASYKW
jgi:hypothetical protein